MHIPSRKPTKCFNKTDSLFKMFKKTEREPQEKELTSQACVFLLHLLPVVFGWEGLEPRLTYYFSRHSCCGFFFFLPREAGTKENWEREREGGMRMTSPWVTCLVHTGYAWMHPHSRTPMILMNQPSVQICPTFGCLFWVSTVVLCVLLMTGAPPSRLTRLLTPEFIISANLLHNSHFLRAATFAAEHSAENRRRLVADCWGAPKPSCPDVQKKKNNPIFLLKYRKQNQVLLLVLKWQTSKVCGCWQNWNTSHIIQLNWTSSPI